MNYEYKTTFADYLEEHMLISVFLAVVVPLIVLITLAIMGMFVKHNLEIAELNERARICSETGYGCNDDRGEQ